MRVLYLCGAGNPEGVRLALRINQQQHVWDQIVLLDDDPARQGQWILGVQVQGPFSLLEQADPQSSEVASLIARTTVKRWAARRKLECYHLPFATLVSPNVDVLGAKLSTDIVVYGNATLGPEASLGEGTVVFMGAIAGHESQLGRCCIVAANAVINARVLIDDGVYIGTGAAILPDVKIGAWATIAAGSMVAQNVPAGATVMGVPGKILMLPGQEAPQEIPTVPALAGQT